MTATASPQVNTTTITCGNGETITVTGHADGTASVTLTRRPLFNTTFTAARIPVDMTAGQAAAEYACQLAAENGGVAQPRIARHRDAKHATITITPCEGPEQRWLVATCYAGTRNIARDGSLDITFSAPDLDRAVEMGKALAGVFNILTIAQALDALPNIRKLLDLAA